MDGRPALPPIHPNWEQEKHNIIEWFNYLWRWQGGEQEPDWDKITVDINNGRFQYMEQKCLPAAFLPFTHPKTWGEAMTWSWSRHIRSTMDEWGRVLRSKGETAMQFQLIDDIPDDEEPIIYKTFVDEVHPSSELLWNTPALLFEKRVQMKSPFPVASEQAALLYDNATPLIQEAEACVPGITSLRDKLRVYEASMPPAAPAITGETARPKWHPTALAVHRDPETFGKNWDREQLRFSDEFTSILLEGHHSWGPAALLEWLKTNPFWDDRAGGLFGGFNGAVVGFYAIMHYAINILRVAPKNDKDEDAMIEQDRRIYGRPNY
ncbi:hypothetical protein FRC08_000872 [Ceratobasidium sp. 394]|nr:hypothetical protein FRC08_000872 [Ceratobasidium sp. 394]